ncbi:tripartite tricarboxylate transporter substrate binding protein [Variovorax sp. J22R24]|uniref:Bug family tripartite tricarboxylate transporter substrate binding protein n=1 Tax=Variovorax gracilis TaxID=3053502 RepID=UPI002576E435|nr:tripartite tricarboxylate transporter substrate binding protein [Variovorax sp. J22R24]MDM0106577.1 tripartite tricarboxylate transporter substrate binding protein [Variovorax sp. J22R24]
MNLNRAIVRSLSTLLAGLSFCFSLTAAAQPQAGEFHAQKPIKLIVPFPPGGGADITARVMAKSAQERLGQPVVVENKPGAEGSIATDFVARAPADGYTLEMATFDTHSIYPHAYPKRPSKALQFRAVVPVIKSQMVLVGRPGLEAKDTTELIALSKKRQLTFASWGKATGSSIGMAAFARAAGMEPYLEVPYQGAGPAVLGVISSQVDLIAVPVPLVKAYPDLKIYGVMGSERSRYLPDAPTFREQKIDVVVEGWTGILAPPGTPDSVIGPLAKSLGAAVADPEVQKSIQSAFLDPFNQSSTQFQAYLDEESARWAKLVKAANLQLD